LPSPEVVYGDSPPQQCVDQAFLAALRDQLPNLCSLPDSFILSTPMSVLLKMESNAMKRSSGDKARSAEDRLMANMDKLGSTIIQVNAGQDNRSSSLHPCRFMAAPTCSAQQLWLAAREAIGTAGIPAVGSYDMAAIGLAGYVTARGWMELHNPASTSLSLRLFNIANMATKVTATKRISLNSSEDSLEVGDSMKDVLSYSEFKQSLRAARTALHFCLPWNFSIAALEGFLINNHFMQREVGTNSQSIALLSAFCDHVFMLNAERWRARKPFLDVIELGSVWAAWASGRTNLHSDRSAKEAKDKKPAKENGRNNTPKPSNSGKKPPKAGQPSQMAKSADDVCRRFNVGKCPNTSGPCTTSTGVTLRHLCNFNLPSGGRCLQAHQRINNH
jgi:hypothetical protein